MKSIISITGRWYRNLAVRCSHHRTTIMTCTNMFGCSKISPIIESIVEQKTDTKKNNQIYFHDIGKVVYLNALCRFSLNWLCRHWQVSTWICLCSMNFWDFWKQDQVLLKLGLNMYKYLQKYLNNLKLGIGWQACCPIF